MFSKLLHTHWTFSFYKEPLVDALCVEVVVAGLYQFDNVAHLDVVIANYAEFA